MRITGPVPCGMEIANLICLTLKGCSSEKINLQQTTQALHCLNQFKKYFDNLSVIAYIIKKFELKNPVIFGPNRKELSGMQFGRAWDLFDTSGNSSTTSVSFDRVILMVFLRYPSGRAISGLVHFFYIIYGFITEPLSH